MASEDNNFASPSNHAPNDNELVTANAAIEMASGDSNFASPIDQAPNDDELVTANATNHDQAHTGLAVGSRLQGTMSHVGEHFHNLGPINHTTYSIVYQVKTNIVTAFQSVVARARAFFPNIVSTIKESFKAAVARFRETFGEKFEKAPRVLLESTKEAVSWAKANPGKTVLLLISGVGIIVPSLVVGPALAALGFGATGVAAGRSNFFLLCMRHANLYDRICGSGHSRGHRGRSGW